MPYNTQQIKRDQQNSPIPQYFNPTLDIYEALLGRNGANFVEILGPNGETLSVVNNKLAVRATELESKLDSIAIGISNGLVTGTVNVGTSAVELMVGASPLANRRKLFVFCIGNDAVYLGPDAAVTTATGYPLLPGEKMSFVFDPLRDVSIFAIAASNQTVRVMEIN